MKPLVIILALGITVFSACGKSIKTAQDFSPNKPPTLESITVSNPGNAAVIPYSSYPVTVTASDPDAGQTLAYTFSSDSGSFASQVSTETGCTVTYIAGDLASGQNVKVFVKVSDGHGGYASSSVNVGTAKQGPTVVVSASAKIIQPTGSLTLSVSANCDGVFQIWPDTSTNPTAKPAAIDTSSISAAAKPMRIYHSGTTPIALAGPTSTAVADAKLTPFWSANPAIPAGTAYSIWVVFRDGLGQIDAVNVPVTVDGVSPTAAWVSPTVNQIGIPLTSTVQISFNEDIDPATLDGALTVTSTNGTNGTVGKAAYTSNSGVYTASYPVSGMSAAFYTAQLSSQIKDLAGNRLNTASNSAINFATYGYSQKDLTSFSFGLTSTNGEIDTISGDTIIVMIPDTRIYSITTPITYYSLNSLPSPTFATTGTSVKVNSAVQTSGSTNPEFTSPVTYTVTGADTSTRTYKVYVTLGTISVNITPPCVYVPIGGTQSLTATVTTSDSSMTNTDVTWSIDNTTVASLSGVTSNGATVTGIAVGTSVITATTLGKRCGTFLIAVVPASNSPVSTTNTATPNFGATTYILPTGTTFTSVAATPATLSTGISFPQSNFGWDKILVNGGYTWVYEFQNDNKTPATINTSFEIGQTQVTYELWSAISAWATDNARGSAKYSFANPGQMGVNKISNPNIAGGIHQPIVAVNWRDAMIWCNALTEYYNANNGSDADLAVVYCADSTYTTPIRTSTNNSTIETTAGTADAPLVNSSAKGFRLPTNAEYEYSARYIGTTSVSYAVSKTTNPSLTEGYYWTPGNYASGAAGPDSTITPSYTNAVAWNWLNATSIQPVGTRIGNALGLYDMCGNGYEWCFDWYDNSNRSSHGSNFYDSAGAPYLEIGYHGGLTPNDHASHPTTFRFARNK